jgi:hypothetical protein
MDEFLTDKELEKRQHSEEVKAEEAALERETLLEFPCQFPIKIMGPATDDFDAQIRALVTAQLGELPPSVWKIRPSAKGNFVGMTLTFTATSKAQIDDLYRAITAHPDVKMCL